MTQKSMKEKRLLRALISKLLHNKNHIVKNEYGVTVNASTHTRMHSIAHLHDHTVTHNYK